MRFTHKAALTTLVALYLFSPDANTQESVKGPYNGSDNYKKGDLVESTFAGNWVNAVVVEIDEAPKKYKIHFEGEKYCSNHATDSYMSREWVRPRKMSANNKSTEQILPPKTDPLTTSGKAVKFNVGDKVIYSNVGTVWLSGATVEGYDADKRLYTLRFASGSGDMVPCHSLAKPGHFNNDFFIGKWDVFVNGAVTTKVIKGDVYDVFSGGLKLAPLEINSNGSFIWRQKGRKDIVGKWSPQTDAPGITLYKGLDGKDWTIYEKTEGYAPTATTRDEIGFHDKKMQTGYYVAYRIGPNQSCVLTNRKFKK